MSDPTLAFPDPDQRLSEAIAAYLEACAAGQPPPLEEVLAQHPDVAEELREFLADHGRLQQLARAFPSEPGQAPPPGTRLRYLGDYELIEEIARGGMGVVYRARQQSLNRVVALKMTLAGELASPAEAARFRTEVETAGNLDHPHIVPIYEVNEFGGQPYFSMRLIEGGSLRQALDDPGWSADLPARVELLARVARAVHHAHQRGVIHRDLKPANILLDLQGQPHVSDFGLARRLQGDTHLTSPGTILGTPAYMAPEQAAGRRDAATTLADVYSLGAILYELLTGQPPFRGETVLETLDLVRTREPAPPRQLSPSLDRDLEAVCLRCLAKEPAQRYASAAELADDLDRWRRGDPISLAPPSLAAQVWRWLRQNVRTTVRLILAGVALTMLPIALQCYGSVRMLLRNARSTYDQMPSIPPPWPIEFNSSPWLPDVPDSALARIAVLISTMLVAACLGPLTVRIVQSRDAWSDLSAGLSVGVVSALTAFFTGVVQAMVLGLVVVPQIDDLLQINRGCFVREWPPPGVEHSGPPPYAYLQEKYPDLKQLPSGAARGNVFFAFLIARMCAATFEAVFYAGLVCLVLGVANGVCQTIAAGYLWRERGGGWRCVLPYAEMVLGSWALAGPLVFGLLVREDEWWVSVLIGLLVCAAAWTGVLRGWRFTLRVSLYCVVLLGATLRDPPKLFDNGVWLWWAAFGLSGLCALVRVYKK